MSFENARPLAAPDLSERRVALLFPQDSMRRYERPMLAYSLGFYACYLLAIAGAVPMWAGGVVGVLCLLRYFNRFHEALHADARELQRWHPARSLLILMGPLYLGFRELREQHLQHHREDGGPNDPDLDMLARSPVRALLASLVQPEISVLHYLRRDGLRREVLAGLGARAAVYAALMWLGGWPGVLLYNLMVRLGNGGAWFVFSWGVHHPWLYGQVRPPRFPAALARAWALVIGRENLYGIRFHYVHHRFPHVPDRDLPALSRHLHGLTQAAPRVEAAPPVRAAEPAPARPAAWMEPSH